MTRRRALLLTTALSRVWFAKAVGIRAGIAWGALDRLADADRASP